MWTVMIPLVDLTRQHLLLEKEVLSGMSEVIRSADFILGQAVTDFENEYASYCGTNYCVGVGNGTDALELSLRALGVGAGDEVVLPANTFIASALAVIRTGAMPVLVDCDHEFQLMDLNQAAAAVTRQTAAIMPVHLFGQPVDVRALESIAPGVPVIEDAAQSQGASVDGVPAGSLGTIAGTSFYPSKNIGAFGDAGAVLTNSADLAKSVRALRNLGSIAKHEHTVVGVNSRLDSLQAVVLRAKLKWLDEWNSQRSRAAALYTEILSSEDRIGLPGIASNRQHVWHLYVVTLDDRDRALGQLQSEGIGVNVHYPTPIHLQRALGFLGYQSGDFPVSESLAHRILSLPIFPGITDSEVRRVADSLLSVVRAN